MKQTRNNNFITLRHGRIPVVFLLMYLEYSTVLCFSFLDRTVGLRVSHCWGEGGRGRP